MASRTSVVHSDRIDYGFWLIFSADGTMRFTRGQPDVLRGERAMKCSTVLPRSLFRTPELRATITLADGQAPDAYQIDIEAAGDALRTALGVDIDLRVERADG